MKDTNYSVLGFVGYTLKSGGTSTTINPAALTDEVNAQSLPIAFITEKGTKYITFVSINTPNLLYTKYNLNFICIDNY